MAEPAGFHVQALEHRGVEQLAGPVVGLAVGVAAAAGQRGGQPQDLLLRRQVRIKIGQTVLGSLRLQIDTCN